MTKFTVKITTQFKKDYKLAIKRGLKIDLLEQIIASLAEGMALPDKNKDHALTGNWVGETYTAFLRMLSTFLISLCMAISILLKE